MDKSKEDLQYLGALINIIGAIILIVRAVKMLNTGTFKNIYQLESRKWAKYNVIFAFIVCCLILIVSTMLSIKIFLYNNTIHSKLCFFQISINVFLLYAIVICGGGRFGILTLISIIFFAGAIAPSRSKEN